MFATAKLTPLGELLRDMTIRAHQEGVAYPDIASALARWNSDAATRLAYDPKNPNPISV
jgi:hypothetical protein